MKFFPCWLRTIHFAHCASAQGSRSARDTFFISLFESCFYEEITFQSPPLYKRGVQFQARWWLFPPWAANYIKFRSYYCGNWAILFTLRIAPLLSVIMFWTFNHFWVRSRIQRIQWIICKWKFSSQPSLRRCPKRCHVEQQIGYKNSLLSGFKASGQVIFIWYPACVVYVPQRRL